MKKLIQITLLSAALAMLLCAAAFAADDASGIQDVQSAGGETIEIVEGKERLSVRRAAETGYYYLLIVQKDDGSELPTQSNIYYIDQQTAEGGSVSFDVYPKTMSSGAYKILMSSNHESSTGLEEIGSFQYYTGSGLQREQIDVDTYKSGAEVNDVSGRTFSVICDKACVVGCTIDGGKTYTALAAVAKGKNIYEFTIPETVADQAGYETDIDVGSSDFGVVVVLRGDVNGNGTVDGRDATRIERYDFNNNRGEGEAAISNGVLSALAEIAANVNGDKTVDSRDATRIERYDFNNGRGEGEPEISNGRIDW